MQTLHWCITTPNTPHADLFLSPCLKEVFIYPSHWRLTEIPHDIIPAVASTISALPSTLRSLRVHRIGSSVDLKDSLSSVALRCGPSLVEFTSPGPLSDVAVNHLIHFPNLGIWGVEGPPPSYSALSLPPTFPPLVEFTLEGCAARGWLSLLERLEDRDASTRGATPLSRAKESLETLTIRSAPGLIIDISFTSPIFIFRNLVNLRALVVCHEGQCIFRLDNDNVTELAMAMPQLESLFLGYPCFRNTCTTTIACLLPISVYCVKLQKLSIHFNTANIVDDLKNISEDPRSHERHSLPRCPLLCLDVWMLLLALDEPGYETVANGMIDIFPSLESCDAMVYNFDWIRVSERIAERKGSRALQTYSW